MKIFCALSTHRDREWYLPLLITEGKLIVGPWYIMPEEILVSGECLGRNFLEGKAEAEKFGGKTWKYGYMNDIFGHVGQMPQILNGFGIDSVYLGRGLGGNDKSFKSFVWKAPSTTLPTDIYSKTSLVTQSVAVQPMLCMRICSTAILR